MSAIPPFVRHAPTADALPLVFDSPHSGEHYPEDFDHAPPRAIVRRAEDTHVARLYGGATRYGATLIEATFPRAYIDANRSLDDLDPGLLADAWPTPIAPSRKTEQGIGLVWRVARGGSPMYDRKLTAEEVQRADRRLVLFPTTGRSVPRSMRCITGLVRSGISTAIRCRPSATRTPTTRDASAPISCWATATARPAHRSSRRSSPRPSSLSATRWRSTTRTRDVELVREARPAGGGPSQPADRAEPAPLHGRSDARGECELRRRRS